MAEQSIGALIPTKIPGLTDNADIQEALRLYHYGSYSYNEANTDPAQLISPSIAHTINGINTNITNLQTNSLLKSVFTAKGDILTATSAGTTAILPAGIDGYFLQLNSFTSTGLEWVAVPTSDVTSTSTTTLTNKTIGPTKETIYLAPPPAGGTLSVDLSQNAFFYYYNTSSSNFAIQFNYVASSLDYYLSDGQSQTVTVLVKNGSTGYYLTSVAVTGGTATTYWQNGSAPTSGNANSIDVYTFTIIKRSYATFDILASVTKYA